MYMYTGTQCTCPGGVIAHVQGESLHMSRRSHCTCPGGVIVRVCAYIHIHMHAHTYISTRTYKLQTGTVTNQSGVIKTSIQSTNIPTYTHDHMHTIHVQHTYNVLTHAQTGRLGPLQAWAKSSKPAPTHRSNSGSLSEVQSSR